MRRCECLKIKRIGQSATKSRIEKGSTTIENNNKFNSFIDKENKLYYNINEVSRVHYNANSGSGWI